MIGWVRWQALRPSEVNGVEAAVIGYAAREALDILSHIKTPYRGDITLSFECDGSEGAINKLTSYAYLGLQP